MSAIDLFKEKAEQAKDKAADVKDRAAEVKEKTPSVDEVTAAAKDKAADVKDKAAEAMDKAAVVKDKAAEIKDRFAPAIKELTDEAGYLAKEAESELKLLTNQAKDIKSSGISSIVKKPSEDDIVALSSGIFFELKSFC